MTFAWYYHLKHTGMPLWKAILLSWGIAFFEYCLPVKDDAGSDHPYCF
jgi:uncharacterized protein (DUF486 family)